jgi:hypothetical protein
MNTVSIIPGHTDPYYYQFLLEGQVKVESYSGSLPSLRRKLLLLRADAVLDLCWQFKKMDDQIIDSRKNVQVHSEYRKRLQDYIDWGYANKESLTGSVIQNGEIVATKYLKPIIDLIQNEQPLKKELVSIFTCIIETSRAADEITK